jgi:hypothetical protein
VINLDGKIVYSKKNIQGNEFQFYLDEAPGIYTLEIDIDGVLQYHKLIIK